MSVLLHRGIYARASATCLWETPWRPVAAFRRFWRWSPATERPSRRWGPPEHLTFYLITVKQTFCWGYILITLLKVELLMTESINTSFLIELTIVFCFVLEKERSNSTGVRAHGRIWLWKAGFQKGTSNPFSFSSTHKMCSQFICHLVSCYSCITKSFGWYYFRCFCG